MHPLEGLAQQASWAGKNIAYNLEFIPEEKLAWKPAPTASSALEIISHVAFYVRAMIPVLGGAEWAPLETLTASTLAEAQELVRSSSAAYASALRGVSPADLGRAVTLPFGSFPLARAASMPVVDLIHHHGQIAYIQSLLGDTEMHFYEMAEE
jgi:uncharacterized damage-inducible protein DinB